MRIKMNKCALSAFAATTLTILSINLSAQKGIDTETPFGSGQDSIRCLQNTLACSGFFESQ